MIQVICDRCNKNCCRSAYVVTVEVIHNPTPIYPTDKGNIKITDTHTTMKMCLCEDCYGEMGFPNVYMFEDSGEMKFKENKDET